VNGTAIPDRSCHQSRYACLVSGLPFSPIAAGEQERAVETLVSAFIDDPVERWLYPELSSYLTGFPRFVAAFAGPAFDAGTVWKLGDVAAVALWLGRGVDTDGDAVAAVLAETVSADLHADAFATLEQMEAAHPRYPHWYLSWLGVKPARRGMGLGGRLLEQCLAIVDESGSPAYLETPNPRTVPFYQRHGFAVTGVAQAGACPPVTLMLREPA
jgi:GNAT superfamily N-acetyltransferase